MGGGSGGRFELLQAIGAYELAHIGFDVAGIAAENTGGVILLENDLVILHEDFQRIAYRDVESSSQFDGKDNTSKLVQLTDDTGRFHTETSFAKSGH